MVIRASPHQEPNATRRRGQTATTPVRSQHGKAIKIPIILGITAVAVMVIAFLLRRFGRRREWWWPIPPGKVIPLDDGNTQTLVCDALGLVGKPDAVRRAEHFFIPEERKSCILPPGQAPFRDHVLQLAAYCYLVAKNLDPVQKGILTYSNGQQYEVPFTNEWIDELRQCEKC